jgi:DNA polymerase III delta prime subunit
MPSRRRSKRIKTYEKPNYKDPDSDNDSDNDDDDDSDTDDEDESLPQALLTLLHEALTAGEVTIDVTSPPSTKRKRRKDLRPDNNTLDPPPLHPTTLTSLIALCQQCEHKHYVDCFRLNDLLGPLQELEAMVGLQTVKQAVVDFILLHLQSDVINLPDMRHMIIAGPPGCGKTSVSTIIAKIMSRLNLCETEKIVYGTQGNLIGGFLGQTAPKTEALIRSAFGGVLVIDEASSLADGRSDQSSDSFSKSCIDTLNRMLSEHGDKFVCIVAGYKKEIYRDILSLNPGMDRRFSTRFEIEPYRPSEILQIIHCHAKRRGVTLLEGEGGGDKNGSELTVHWIQANMGLFKNAGGDCLLLMDTIIMEHAKRSFGRLQKNQVTTEDVARGLAVVQKRHADLQTPPPECLKYMYT